MNSVANGKIREQTGFRDVFIQPASGDNGTALGAAFYAWHQIAGRPRGFVMEHGYWGPSFDDDAIAAALDAEQAAIAERGCARRAWTDEAALDDWTAAQIAAGRVVGWFQGRMEWGARALGNRSILADPRRADMREIINTRIKFRERFRPFAPSVLEEALDDYFVGAVPDPFMLQVYPVRPDKRAVVPGDHARGRLGPAADGEPRDRTRGTGSLINAFARLSGVPMLLNTSFNENEPIVLTPAEALDCFLRTQHGRARHRPPRAGTAAAAWTISNGRSLSRLETRRRHRRQRLPRPPRRGRARRRAAATVLVPRKAQYDLTREADVARMYADLTPHDRHPPGGRRRRHRRQPRVARAASSSRT